LPPAFLVKKIKSLLLWIDLCRDDAIILKDIDTSESFLRETIKTLVFPGRQKFAGLSARVLLYCFSTPSLLL